MSTECLTEACNEVVGPKSKIGLCPRCYSAIYNANKKTKKQQIEYYQKLQLYISRQQLLNPGVTPIVNAKKRKRRLEIVPGTYRNPKSKKVAVIRPNLRAVG